MKTLLAIALLSITNSAVATSAADTSQKAMKADTDLECSGSMILSPERKDHVRQDYVRCRATGPVYDLDMRICRVEGAEQVCVNNGSGDYFNVTNVVRDLPSLSFKVTAQNSNNQPSNGVFSLHYSFLFRPDPCTSGGTKQRLKCLAGLIVQLDQKVDKLPSAFESLRADAAGFGCSDPEWCVVVTPSGDLFMGNPSFVVGNYPKLVEGQNILRDLKDKSPRGFQLSCRVVQNWGRWCDGVDSKGNVYSGLIEPNMVGGENFFQFRSGPAN